jgi:hypothetical protein
VGAEAHACRCEGKGEGEEKRTRRHELPRAASHDRQSQEHKLRARVGESVAWRAVLQVQGQGAHIASAGEAPPPCCQAVSQPHCLGEEARTCCGRPH